MILDQACILFQQRHGISKYPFNPNKILFARKYKMGAMLFYKGPFILSFKYLKGNLETGLITKCNVNQWAIKIRSRLSVSLFEVYPINSLLFIIQSEKISWRHHFNLKHHKNETKISVTFRQIPNCISKDVQVFATENLL